MPNTVDFGLNLQANTKRGPSWAIWEDAPVLDVLEDPTKGMYFNDDFTDGPWSAAGNNGEKSLGKWAGFVANSASALLGTPADTTNLPMEGGVLGLTCGSNNNLSISLAAAPSAYRLVSPATGFPLTQKCWFECSIAVSSVASGAFDLFVGLMDTGDGGTRITSAADLIFSAANTIKTASGNGGCLGFWKRATTNPADVALVYNANNGTAQNPGSTTLQKLASTYGPGAMAALAQTNNIPTAIGTASGACFFKFGFVYDPTPSCPQLRVATAVGSQTVGNLATARLQVYVNGQVAPVFLSNTEVQASTFPSSFMAPVIGFRTGGSGAGIAYVDFVRCLQLANS